MSIGLVSYGYACRMGNGPTSVICGNNICLAQNVGSIKQNPTTTPGDMEVGLSCLGLKGKITKVFLDLIFMWLTSKRKLIMHVKDLTLL